MGLGKQSKVLNKTQIEMISNYLRSKRNGLRNQTIFLLSVKSGLRAKEISNSTGSMYYNLMVKQLMIISTYQTHHQRVKVVELFPYINRSKKTFSYF